MTSRILYTPRDGKRSRLAPRRVFLPVALGVLAVSLLGAGIFFLRLPTWQVQRVIVDGGETVSEDRLREEIMHSLAGSVAWVIPRGSLFFVPTRAIIEGLQQKFPQIARLGVRIHFPDTLSVSIQEHKFWGIFCNDLEVHATSTCVSIDRAGYAYAAAPVPSGGLIMRIRSDTPDTAIRSQAVGEDVMDRLEIFLRELPLMTGATPVGFELHAQVPSEIAAEMSGGYRILFRRNDDFANTFRILKKVLDSEISEKRARLEYIDVRFGNKVFYKMK